MPFGKEVGLGPGHIVLDGDAVGNALFTCHSFAITGHDSFGQVGLKSQQGRPRPEQMGLNPPAIPQLNHWIMMMMMMVMMMS